MAIPVAARAHPVPRQAGIGRPERPIIDHTGRAGICVRAACRVDRLWCWPARWRRRANARQLYLGAKRRSTSVTTVRELIDMLAAHPPDMRVVLHFQEGTGYDDVMAVEVERIERDSNATREIWDGLHGSVEPRALRSDPAAIEDALMIDSVDWDRADHQARGGASMMLRARPPRPVRRAERANMCAIFSDKAGRRGR